MVLKCLNSGCCQDLLLMLGRLEGLCLPFESTKSQQVGLSGLIGRAVSKFSISLTIHHQKCCSELSCTFGFASRLSASDFCGIVAYGQHISKQQVAVIQAHWSPIQSQHEHS